MGVEGKIVRFDLFGGFGVGGIVEQNGAEDGLFGVDVRGHSGIESEVWDGGHRRRV